MIFFLKEPYLRAFQIILVFTVSFGCLSNPAQATHAPDLIPANSRLFILDNDRTDFAARIAAIEQATADTPILFITYILACDESITVPFVMALRRAADRGVPVRIINSAVTTPVYDILSTCHDLLLDSALAKHIEYTEIGGLHNNDTALILSDSTHEKILTIGDLVFHGGRNADGAASRLDLTIATLPIDRSQANLGSQLKAQAERLWRLVTQFSPAQQNKPLTKRLKAVAHRYDRLRQIHFISEAEQEQFDDFQRFRTTFAHLEFTALNGHMTSNDFLTYALTGIYGTSREERLRMPDDIVDDIIGHLAGAHEIDIATMALIMLPRLEKAIAAAVSHGARLRIYTNDEESAGTLMPRSVSYFASLPQAVSFLRLDQNNQGGPRKVNIFGLLTHPVANRELEFLHLKFMRIDDTVIWGSSNFNINSTVGNNETVAMVQSPELAAHFKNFFDDSNHIFRPITLEQAQKDYNEGPAWGGAILDHFLRVFY